MRTPDTRTHDPLARHELLRAIRYEFKPNKQLDEESRQAVDRYRAPAAERRRVRAGHGQWAVILELADVLEREGLIQNDIEPELDPAPIYENDAIPHFRGAVPTRTLGAAAQVGTGATLTFADACDAAGRLVLVTGTGALASGVLATITFAMPRQNANYGVAIWAADSDAAGTAGRSVHSDFGGRTSTTWTLNAASALAASTSYHFEYWVHDRTSL